MGPHPLQVKSAKNGRKLRILSGLCQEFWNLKEADGRKLESPARQPQRYGPGSGCCGRFDFHRYRRRLWTRDLDWLRENIARSFLGIAACSQGKRVRFHTTTGLVTQLLEAREERTLQRLHKQLERQDVILLDELGYVPFSKAGAELLFDVVGRAYERTSLIVTTNLPFELWTEVLGSERLTGAQQQPWAVLFQRGRGRNQVGGRGLHVER